VARVTAVDHLSGVLPGSFHVTGTSNEPSGSGQISIISERPGQFDIWLEASRSESGDGRTYTLTARASDRADNVSTVTTVCIVPKHRHA